MGGAADVLYHSLLFSAPPFGSQTQVDAAKPPEPDVPSVRLNLPSGGLS